MASSKRTVALLAAALAVAAPASASAADQVVSGTTVDSSLALGAPVAATFGANLGAASPVDTTGGEVEVTAIGPWVMRVSGSDSGRLSATAVPTCTGSAAILTNPLDVFASATLGNFTAVATSGSPVAIGSAAAEVANGTGSNVVTLGYRFSPAAGDQLTAACPYTMTSTVDLAAT